MSREIIYPPGGIDVEPVWRPIATAPHDGTHLTIGWVERGRLLRERDSHWSVAGNLPHWDGGGGYPTHWRPLS